MSFKVLESNDVCLVSFALGGRKYGVPRMRKRRMSQADQKQGNTWQSQKKERNREDQI